MSRRRFKSGWLIGLVAALLWAQLGALAHTYSHLHVRPSPTDPAGGHARLCSDCLEFAPLLAAADGPAQFLVPPVIAPDVAPGDASESLIAREFHFAFRSRAPPLS